ncbi:hypothetical protein SE957_07160 [Escherichia coli]|nr:hypothetical protein [Escherichia coli]
MATEHMNQLTPKELDIYKRKYKSAYKQFDKYFLFIERSIQILKDHGYLGYILPSRFIKVDAGKNYASFYQKINIYLNLFLLVLIKYSRIKRLTLVCYF